MTLRPPPSRESRRRRVKHRKTLMMRSAVLASALAVVFLASAPSVQAQSATAARALTPQDIFKLQWSSDPEISPDGKHIVYVRQSADIMNDKLRQTLWLVDVASGVESPLVEGGGAQPRWSPDGGRIAYVAEGEGGTAQLLVHWVASGKTARIAVLPEAPSSITWSPDGASIAFTMLKPEDGEKIGAPPAKPEGAKWADPIQVITDVTYRVDGEDYLRHGYHHLFLIDAEGGAPRQITFGKTDDRGVLSWSRDGRSVVFTSRRGEDWEREPIRTNLFEVDVSDLSIKPLTKQTGAFGEPQVSPDGRMIAYVGSDDKRRGYENSRLIVMNRDGGGARVISAGLDRAVFNPRWAANGQSLYVSYDDHGEAVVVKFSLNGAMTRVVGDVGGGDHKLPYSASMPLGHSEIFSVARNGVLAFNWGAAEAPADLGVLEGGVKRKLTALNRELFREKDPAHVTLKHAASSADGLPVDYWMMTPPNYDPGRKYPLILEIHGGPFASYGPLWSTEDQLFAAAGYVVVYANPRGSTSYGDTYANLIHDNYPSKDYDDLMSVVDDAIAHGPVDSNNLFVTGGSGGGALTAWIVGKNNRFKAAVSQKPVVNWTSEALSSDYYIVIIQDWFAKTPWEDPQEYWRRSPLSLVGNVQTPTMMIVGTSDHRTPATESEQYYQALQLRHIPTALLRVPGASHLKETPSQTATRVASILAWFERYQVK
jgi:dipeptidyl aminopeptidase/acylaminoacyl peptidase